MVSSKVFIYRRRYSYISNQSVSMLDPWKFQLIDKIGRIINHHLSHFGGIHVVVCGDFLQLPGVRCDTFAFECDLWRESISKVCLVRAIIC